MRSVSWILGLTLTFGEECTLNEYHIKSLYELTTYENCTSLPYVYILGCPDCEDLSPLAKLVEIRTKYKTAAGPAVSLRISSSPNLKDVSHLSSLTGTLPGGIFINDNQKLENLDGLENLKGLNAKGHSLVIGANPSLESIAGLKGISGAVPGVLYIDDNPKLKNLYGLEGVSSWETVSVTKSGTAMDVVCESQACLHETGLLATQAQDHSEL